MTALLAFRDHRVDIPWIRIVLALALAQRPTAVDWVPAERGRIGQVA
jgi:hypothetical protein